MRRQDKLADRYDLEDKRKDAAGDTGKNGSLKRRCFFANIIITNNIDIIVVIININTNLGYSAVVGLAVNKGLRTMSRVVVVPVKRIMSMMLRVGLLYICVKVVVTKLKKIMRMMLSRSWEMTMMLMEFKSSHQMKIGVSLPLFSH